MRTAVRASFNLLDQPWIPVSTPGGASDLVSLLEVARNARAYTTIGHADPLVTIAVHRLVLAFLHRALDGPSSSDEAGDWYSDGFPQQKIEGYAQKWRHRFDLFDAERPFLQQPGIEFEPLGDHWTRLSSARGSFNTNVLFRPELRSKAPPEGDIFASEAALELLGHQAFTLGGLIKRLGVTSAKGSPLATAALTLVNGENLHQTLCLNLVPYAGRHSRNDAPVWERDQPSLADLQKPREYSILGLAASYVWPARAILLRPDSEGRVEKMYYAAGQPPTEGRYPDPMMTLVKNAKGEDYPMGYREGKGMWRDLHSFVPKPSARAAPEVIEHASTLLLSQGDYDTPLTFSVFGMVNNKAKIALVRQERLQLPSVFLRHHALAERLEGWIKEAGDGAFRLKQALQVLARGLISLGENVDPNSIKAQVSAFGYEERYWPEAERAFWRFLGTLAHDPTEFAEQVDERARQWTAQLNTLVHQTYSDIAESLGRSARTLRAIERGRTNLKKGFQAKTS